METKRAKTYKIKIKHFIFHFNCFKALIFSSHSHSKRFVCFESCVLLEAIAKRICSFRKIETKSWSVPWCGSASRTNVTFGRIRMSLNKTTSQKHDTQSQHILTWYLFYLSPVLPPFGEFSDSPKQCEMCKLTQIKRRIDVNIFYIQFLRRDICWRDVTGKFPRTFSKQWRWNKFNRGYIPTSRHVLCKYLLILDCRMLIENWEQDTNNAEIVNRIAAATIQDHFKSTVQKHSQSRLSKSRDIGNRRPRI